MSDLKVKKVRGLGLGVFANKNFKRGNLIEKCPVLLCPGLYLLRNHLFSWSKGRRVIALGNGSLYNHSFSPNAVYHHDYKNKCIRFFARRNIKKGEEIRVNYNGNPFSLEKVWFEVE